MSDPGQAKGAALTENLSTPFPRLPESTAHTTHGTHQRGECALPHNHSGSDHSLQADRFITHGLRIIT